MQIIGFNSYAAVAGHPQELIRKLGFMHNMGVPIYRAHRRLIGTSPRFSDTNKGRPYMLMVNM